MYDTSSSAAFGGPLFLLAIVCAYIYLGYAQYRIAQKLGHDNPWFSFVPIVNVIQIVQMAQKPLWWFVLILIPVVNVIALAILWITIAKRLGQSPVVGFLTIIPLLNFITLGVMGFGSGSSSPGTYPPPQHPQPKQPEHVG